MLKSAITHSTLDMQPAVLPVERDDLCVEEAAELFLLLDSEPFPTESALRSTGHVGVLHHAHVRDVPGRVEEVGSHVVQQGLVLWGVIVCAGQDMLPEVGLDLRKSLRARCCRTSCRLRVGVPGRRVSAPAALTC